jgi:hypothetical protein
MDGWQTSHRQAPDGAIESEQRVALARPVVEFSAAGAERLGRSYWQEVRRLTGSFVRPRERGGGGLELRLLGGPVLLRFGRPTLEASETRACCSYPIAGGLLTRRAGGELTFEQTAGALSSTVRGFFPRVANYDRLQGRAHVAISRRYFRRLIAEAPR